MITSDIRKRLSNGSAMLTGLPVRKKIALVLLSAVMGTVILDVGDSASPGSSHSSVEVPEQDDFSEIDSLLATFDDVDTVPVRQRQISDEESDDLTGILTTQSASELSVPGLTTDTYDVPESEISHSDPIVTIPAETAVASSPADSGNSAPQQIRSESSIRLTGTIYPVR